MILDVFRLADRLTEDFCALRPTDATMWGVVGFDGSWGDWSPAGWEQIAELLATALSDVDALPPTEDRWEIVGRRVVREFAETWIDRIDQCEHLRDINNIASPVQDIRSVFEVQPKATSDDWRALVARLANSSEPVAGFIACLEEGRRQALVAARRQVEACIRQLEVNCSDSSPFSGLLSEFDAAGLGAGALRSRLIAGIDQAQSASGELRAYLHETYLPAAKERDAVGRDRYLRLVEPFLGSSLDPEATYAWGWREIERLWERAASLAQLIVPGASVAEAIAFLKTDPDRAAHSSEEFVALMKERQEQALQDLAGTHFDVPDAVREVDVQLAPAGGALGAHYHGPSEDFSRPGTVWYSLGSKTTIPLYAEISTAYHEGFPGHHLQTGIQMSLSEHLTRLHRTLAWRSGYGEGWALYAEGLMDELGYFEKPDYELGLVASQLLRACRIVIDIGMHLDLEIESDIVAGDRWTFDKAVSLLRSHAFLERDYAESEVTRYLGWPGQAISYKLGEQAILDLREARSEARDFDLKAFHGDVLGSGPVGLDHLREIVLGS